ncbi:MAG: TrbI/VirB10 family protein [Candidatus Obscuribacterales bacterium]|nr:TrbI/VirB10 family protein [Candidatus Obscuribacterales bacterium]
MKAHKSYLKRSLIATTLILGQTFAMPLLPVLAADGDVLMAGQVVLNDIASAGSWTSEKRAELIQTNLDNALVASKDLSPSAVAVTYVKGSPVLTLGGYQVATVDSASAKLAHTTPTLLAKRWADALRNALRDQASVEAYVAQISGSYQASAPSTIPSAPVRETAVKTPAAVSQPSPQSSMSPVIQGRVVYAPAGLVIPATLSTSISSDVAKPGDMIQAQISQPIILGDMQIPQGSTLIGQVSDSTAGKMLGRSGALEIKFNRLRTMEGQEIPLTAHLVGGISKYKDSGSDRSDSFHGETWKGKALQAGVRGLIGAGTGAALGTAVGAIAGGTRGVGRGAWSGTAIGAGVGVAQSLILRKGQNVVIASGTPIQLQLDAPVQFMAPAPVAYSGQF